MSQLQACPWHAPTACRHRHVSAAGRPGLQCACQCDRGQRKTRPHSLRRVDQHVQVLGVREHRGHGGWLAQLYSNIGNNTTSGVIQVTATDGWLSMHNRNDHKACKVLAALDALQWAGLRGHHKQWPSVSSQLLLPNVPANALGSGGHRITVTGCSVAHPDACIWAWTWATCIVFMVACMRISWMHGVHGLVRADQLCLGFHHHWGCQGCGRVHHQCSGHIPGVHLCGRLHTVLPLLPGKTRVHHCVIPVSSSVANLMLWFLLY